MRFKIFLFCLFFYLNANSQTSPLPNNETRKSGLSKEEFTYACNEYKKMILTDEYLKSEEKIRAFNEKIQDFVISHNIPFDSLKNKDVSLKLIKNNLTQTKFKSVAEAELYIDEMESSTEKLEKKNEYLYELISKATPEQFMKISQPFFDRVKSELDH